MTTIPDAVKATLDAQWTAAGGAEPPYYIGEDYTYSSPPPEGKEYIWIISKDLDTRIKPLNDAYSTITHTLPIIVNTTTSGDRLKEIADEIQRILGTVAITGANFQRVSRRELIPNEKLRGHKEHILLTIITFLADSGTAYGAYTTTTFIIDELTVNTSLTLGRTVTAILDEDDMVSDSASSLATQQSIKKYADDVATATLATAAADVDADIVTHAAIAAAHHAKYTDAEALIQAATLISDTVYGAGWDTDTTHAASKNSLYDKINAMDTLIAANTTTAEVEAIITAELVNGQSIDNAIDTLITTHTGNAAAHHAKYTDAEVEAIITAELVNGQSIDNAIDALIATHTAIEAAHHTKYTDAEVEAIISADCGAGQTIDNAIDALIATHTSDDDAHHNYGMGELQDFAAINGALEHQVGPAAGISLIEFPAADNSCSGLFTFMIPRHAPTGKTWYVQITYLTETAADTHTFTYNLSAYKAGDAYTGWNKNNGTAYGDLTTADAWVRYESEKSLGAVIDPEDIVCFQLNKTSTDSQQLDIVGIALYWK